MTTLTTGRATDFITFSRPGATGGGATVTDSDGKIKWAGHNLLTNSESFNTSSWAGSNRTVSANVQVAPNGETTADTVTTTDNFASLYAAPGVTPGASYTFAFWAKRGTMTDVKLSVFDLTNSANIVAATSYYSSINASTWTLVTQTFTAPAGCQNVWVYPIRDSGVTGTIHLWGAHLYRSDLGGMVLNPARGDAYYPTTPRNLIGYTEDFSVWNASAWQTNGLLAFGSGSVANAVAAPNGLQTADLITPDTASNFHRIFANVPVVSSTKLLFACYAKSNGYTKIGIRETGTSGAGAAFDLAGSGSVIGAFNTGGSTVSDMAISSVGDGWFRISCVISFASATNMRFGVHILSPSYTSGALDAFWTPNGTSGIYLWGAQLSDSASLDAYSPVYGAAVTSAAYYAPRLDFDPVTLAARGLLVEEQRTNLLQHTQALENAYWTKLTADAATKVASPDGTNSANLLYPTSSTNFVGARYIFAATTYTSGFYTISFYAKAAGKNVVGLVDFNAAGIAAWFNLSTGLTTSGVPGYTATMTPAGNSWYRCTMTNTSSHSNSLLLYVWVTINDAAGGNGVTVSGTDGAHIYGMQIEFGTFATSYIPNGSAVAGATRTADVASVSTQAFPYGVASGSFVVSGVRFGGAGYGPLVVPRNTATGINDRNPDMSLGAGAGGAAGSARVDVVSGGSVIAPLGNTSGSFVNGTIYKVGYAYATSDYASVVNGGVANTQASGGAPPSGINQVDIGQRNSSAFLNGWIRQITVIPRRLSNSELQARTV